MALVQCGAGYWFCDICERHIRGIHAFAHECEE